MSKCESIFVNFSTFLWGEKIDFNKLWKTKQSVFTLSREIFAKITKVDTKIYADKIEPGKSYGGGGALP